MVNMVDKKVYKNVAHVECWHDTKSNPSHCEIFYAIINIEGKKEEVISQIQNIWQASFADTPVSVNAYGSSRGHFAFDQISVNFDGGTGKCEVEEAIHEGGIKGASIRCYKEAR